ncbi:serine hydrolase domain-containing protein [Paenibacillus aestuarii]|uniref:Serine hydrolase domain-containing protein n=1 Tax=Paenibacillus aestuarii TaxID=516965 RepID=A0ABW0KAW9_9BACL|nr:serine hydrolase [Paenibacillus aestuarii]
MAVALIATFMMLTVVPKYSLASAEALDINNTEQLKKYVDDYFAKEMDTYHIPGAAITFVKDGKALFSAGYGYADLDKKTKVDPNDTVFRIGSVTKTFTATAIMQLYEQRKIDLNADINEYLKGFKIHGLNNKPVTVSNLLTHTAGFDEYYEDLSAKPEPLQQFMKTHAPAMINEPGVESLYSNYGYALLGYIVESVSGETYDQYIQNHILNPLGMKTATLHKNENDHIASSYAYDAAKQTYTKQPYVITDNYAPAGNLSMKIPDMDPYMMAQLQSGSYHNALLKDETSQLMQAKHFSKDPSLSGFGFGLWEDIPRQHRAVMHGGTVDGFRTWMYLIPEEKLGFTIFTNGSNGHALNQAFIDDFNKHFYPVAPVNNTAKLNLSEEAMKPYTGTFISTRYFHYGIGRFGPKISPPATTVIEATGPSELKVTSGSHVQTFVAERENMFVEKNGSDRLFYYKTAKGDLHFTLSSYPMSSYERQTSAIPALASGIALVLIIILSTIILIISALIGMFKKDAKSTTKPIRRVALIANILYIVTLPLAFTYWNDLFGAAPTPWKIALYTAAIAFVLYIIVALMWVSLIKRKSVNGWVKFGYIIPTIAGLLLTPYMIYWNLVGKFVLSVM